MKKLMMAALLATVFAVPVSGFANLKGVSFDYSVFYGEPEECATEVKITSIDGGLINGTESLNFNGTSVGDFSSLKISAGYKVGDSILFASHSFADRFGLEPGIDYDVEIADEDCADLEEGDEITFTGSFGMTICNFTLSARIQYQAFEYDATDDDYEAVDLTSQSIELSSLSNSWSLGGSLDFGADDDGGTGSDNGGEDDGGDTADDSGGAFDDGDDQAVGPGCTLSGDTTPRGSDLIVLLGLGLVLLASTRLRRHAQQR